MNNCLVVGGHVGVDPTVYSNVIANIMATMPQWSVPLIDSIFPTTWNTKVSVCATKTDT